MALCHTQYRLSMDLHASSSLPHWHHRHHCAVPYPLKLRPRSTIAIVGTCSPRASQFIKARFGRHLLVLHLLFLLVARLVVLNRLLPGQREPLSILKRIVQVLLAVSSKDTALVELASQRDDVVVEKPDLALEPTQRRLRIGTIQLVRPAHLLEQPVIPFHVNIEVLHAVADIRSLDEMLDDDGGLAVLCHQTAQSAFVLAALLLGVRATAMRGV
mmetsp:Transcript_9348/g.25399  ORF Transcript_9348/g.25399 Transcript_9348/m.25399 type:complete len:215 (-) Transcript_9348:802-1446(-)